MKRSLLLIGALLLTAQALLASYPSARTQARMVYDPVTTHMILFGGFTDTDAGTKLVYDLNETWEFTGLRWVQRFPAHSPAARSTQGMVFDTARNRVVLFGGKAGTSTTTTTVKEFNDTWIYQNDDWTELNTPSAPAARQLPGMTYDPIRDRIVLFGGTFTTKSADGRTTTVNPYFDTWEFDGTTWTQRATDGPHVAKPILQYDPSRNEIILLGLGDSSETLMYRYDPAAATWTKLTPAALPPCVNESATTFEPNTNKILLTGGSCTTSSVAEETWEWDGTTWTKVDTHGTEPNRVFGHVLGYDVARNVVVVYGGTVAFGLPRSTTYLYGSTIWLASDQNGFAPGPRSLFAFTTDPVNNAVWLLGGTADDEIRDDLWRYQNGQWSLIKADGAPANCVTPNGVWDTARQKSVFVCASSEVFEWDGKTWTKPTLTDTKNQPPARRFSSMVYDETLKKTVLYGGFNDTNYIDETWLWDGTAWSRQKKNPAPSRALASMWYDPVLKKTVLYGGIGRLTSLDRITRYSDMWSFDGTGWTDMTITATPGARYGAQTDVDPRTGHTVVYGGLRLDTSATGVQTQVYADDTWEWDGTAWKQIATDVAPPARENGRIAWDPSRRELTLFGGWGGHLLADLWHYDGKTWSVFSESPRRRRASGR